jgi:hypothetical protein
MRWKSRLSRFLWWISGLVLMVPGQAAATQVHVPSEGLYVHQIAHLFFALSMALLLYWLRQRKLVRDRGWRLIQLASLFFIIWNVDAFLVHILDDRSDLFRTIDAGTWHASIQFDREIEWLAFLYYLGKMDHLLCAPGMILLYFGLRSLLHQAQGKQEAVGKSRAGIDGQAPTLSCDL